MKRPRRQGRWVDGGLAGALALGALWAASRLSPEVAFPPLALAERVVRVTPGDLATLVIERLGHYAVPLLTAGSILALLAACAALPLLTQRDGRPRPACAAVLLVTTLVAIGLLDPGGASIVAYALACAVAGTLYGVALAALAGTGPSVGGTAISRREALSWIGASTALFMLGGGVLGRLVPRRGPDTDVALATPVRRARIPARPPFPAVPGLAAEVTPVAEHYVVDIDIVDPIVEARDWALSVRGAVDRPLELGFEELQRRFRVVEEHSVLVCVSNEIGGDLVGSSRWTGVRLRDVVRAASPRSSAVDVIFRCADGYTVTVPVARAMHPTGLLAVGQNGRPLTQEHGFPCRVRLPALYGMMNAKWLEAIEVVEHDAEGYWARRGWSDEGVVRTQSRIDTRGALRAGRPAWIAGVAWAGLREISGVDVSVDGGRTWRAATVRAPISPYAWSQWAYRWTPPRAGIYRVLCRATDGEGRVQEARRRRPHPSGASGYHQIGLRAE